MSAQNIRQLIFSLSVLVLVDSLTGCGGDDGVDGMQGPVGEAGPRGSAGLDGENGEEGANGANGEEGSDGAEGADGADGPKGESGEDGVLPEGTLNASCLTPCHGYEGVVAQWKTSTHFASTLTYASGENDATWTGARSCGTCHARDAIEYRLAGDVLHEGEIGPVQLTKGQLNYLDSESGKVMAASYAGQSSIALGSCFTCHDAPAESDPHLTGADYEAGSFPLRVPTSDTDFTYLEKSSAVGVSDGTEVGSYGRGNACIWCHKSREDVTNYLANETVLTSVHWGPHSGPDADIFTARGGYEFGANEYSSSTHETASSLSEGCVSCHMAANDAPQEFGVHSFAPSLSTCISCHFGATDFDIGKGQTFMKAILRDMRTALNDAGWLTRSDTEPYEGLTSKMLADDEFSRDQARPSATSLSRDEAGALYNYFLVARGSALGVHNPNYAKQLLYDSHMALEGVAPPSMGWRP